MAALPVQSLTVAKNTGGAASLQSVAFGSSPVAGNSILVFIWTENATAVPSVTDTTGVNTYVQDGVIANGNDKCWIYRAANITGGSAFKITVTMSGNTFITFTAEEFSGLANSSPLDGAGSTNTGAGGTSITTGAFSTLNANDLIVAAFASAGMTSLGSNPAGFTSIGQNASNGTNEDGSAVYKVVSATQTGINPTWAVTLAGSSHWASIALAYKAAVAATGGIPLPLLLTPQTAI